MKPSITPATRTGPATRAPVAALPPPRSCSTPPPRRPCRCSCARTSLARANGHVGAGEIVANTFVGGPVGRFLLRLGTAVPFFANAALTAAASVLLVVLRRAVAEPGPARSTGSSVRADVAVGLRVVWRDPLLRTLVGCSVVLNTLYAAMLGVQVCSRSAAPASVTSGTRC